MFDRVCKHSSAEQLTCRWPQSHTPRRETITSEAHTDRREPVTQAQARYSTLLRNETCLLSYSIMKQNRPENHNRIPSHPDTPHPSPSLTPIYRPLLLCQLLFRSFPSLLGQLFLLACASHRPRNLLLKLFLTQFALSV